MMLVLCCSDHHTINLTCEIETECIRWCFYLKVLLVWFHKTGSDLLARMQAGLEDSKRIFYSRMTSYSQFYQSSEEIHLISKMARHSLESFINEHSDIGSLTPMHIDVSCMGCVFCVELRPIPSSYRPHTRSSDHQRARSSPCLPPIPDQSALVDQQRL